MSDYNGLNKSIVGKRVKCAYLDKVTNHVVFEFEDPALDNVHWDTAGDCCSNSWIEHADLELVKGLVHSVEEVPLSESWYQANPYNTREYNDGELILYGVTIQSEGGTGTIDFRNESNGYYGGHIFAVGY